MDIENLNKSQIVLLTLLVSFMTSIATGIVTVSLMEQAPPAITETVNRVVERTVEKVVPGQAAAAAEPIVKTVVVNDSELIPKAVETASPSIVRLFSGEATSSAFLGLGVVLDSAGTVAVDSQSVGEAKDLAVELSGSLKVPATFLRSDEETGLAYLRAATSTKDGRVFWSPMRLASAKPVLGQTVVLITGKSAARVGQGLVTSISDLSETSGANAEIETDLPKDVIMYGSPIVDTSGQLLGVSTKASRSSNEAGFVASSLVVPRTPEAKAEGQSQ